MPIQVTGTSRFRRHGARAGFTLLELLVVVAIIAVLAMLLVPLARRSIDRSRQVQCAANLRGLGMLFSMYAGENNGEYPPMWMWDVELVEKTDSWSSLKLWQCPSDLTPRTPVGTVPGHPEIIAPPRSYILNGFLVNLYGWHPMYPGHPADQGCKTSRIQHPPLVWLLTEYHQHPGDSWTAALGTHPGSIMGTTDRADVHGGSVNVLMTDGHVESIRAANASAWFYAHWGNVEP